MRYKVGDKVVIRNDLVENVYFMDDGYHYTDFVDSMEKYRGKTLIVGKTSTGYHIEGWHFTDEMINHEATAKLNEVKPVDLLETGMIVEFKNKEVMIVLKGDLKIRWYGTQDICFIDERNFMALTNYSDDLICESYEGYTINKIYKKDIRGLVGMFETDQDCELIWERKPEPKQPKVITYTMQELMDKLGLDGDTEIKIVDKK